MHDSLFLENFEKGGFYGNFPEDGSKKL